MPKTEEKYIKVKTKGTVRLEEFAEEYDLSVEALVNFHNQHCQFSEFLPLSLPTYVEHLYLPLEKHQARKDKLIKSTRLQLPVEESVHTYGIIINYALQDLKLHYEIQIETSEEGVEINKKQTYVNDKAIEKTVEQLFEKAGQVLFPLRVSRRSNGTLIKILNPEEIEKRWKEDCRPELEDYYQSEEGDKIINQLDEAYNGLDSKIEELLQNIFYRLFFNGVYRNYPDYSRKEDLSVYFMGLGRKVNYQTTYSLEPEYTRSGKIALWIKGKEKEGLFNKNQPKGGVNLKYKFTKEPHHIFSITGTLSTFKNTEMHEIEFEVHKQ